MKAALCKTIADVIILVGATLVVSSIIGIFALLFGVFS